MEAELRSRILKLLKEDKGFRYAVAGPIGLEDLRRGKLRTANKTAPQNQPKRESNHSADNNRPIRKATNNKRLHIKKRTLH